MYIECVIRTVLGVHIYIYTLQVSPMFPGNINFSSTFQERCVHKIEVPQREHLSIDSVF